MAVGRRPKWITLLLKLGLAKQDVGTYTSAKIKALYLQRFFVTCHTNISYIPQDYRRYRHTYTRVFVFQRIEVNSAALARSRRRAVATYYVTYTNIHTCDMKDKSLHSNMCITRRGFCGDDVCDTRSAASPVARRRLRRRVSYKLHNTIGALFLRLCYSYSAERDL